LSMVRTGSHLSGRVSRSLHGSLTVSRNIEWMLPSLTLGVIERATKYAAEGLKTSVKGLTIDDVPQPSERDLEGQAGVAILLHDIESLFQRDLECN
jgi:hypothetical protein